MSDVKPTIDAVKDAAVKVEQVAVADAVKTEQAALADTKAEAAKVEKSAMAAGLNVIKRILVWAKDHIGIVFSVAGAAAVYILVPWKKNIVNPAEKLAVELDAVQAKTQAAAIAAEQGAEAAKAHVAQTYATQLAALTEKEKSDAAELTEDPAALAAYLVRVGARLAAKA